MTGTPETVSWTMFDNGAPLKVTYPDGTNVEHGYDRLGRHSWIGLRDPNAVYTGVQQAVL